MEVEVVASPMWSFHVVMIHVKYYTMRIFPLFPPRWQSYVLALLDCCETEHTQLSGCLNLADSKAELLPESEVEGSNVFVASDTNTALSERIHPLLFEEVCIS